MDKPRYLVSGDNSIYHKLSNRETDPVNRETTSERTTFEILINASIIHDPPESPAPRLSRTYFATRPSHETTYSHPQRLALETSVRPSGDSPIIERAWACQRYLRPRLKIAGEYEKVRERGREGVSLIGYQRVMTRRTRKGKVRISFVRTPLSGLTLGAATFPPYCAYHARALCSQILVTR